MTTLAEFRAEQTDYARGGRFVYFIVGEGQTKIGLSANPMARLKILQTGSPIDLQIQRVVEGSWRLEKHLHNHFADRRVNGEWFEGEFTDEEIDDAVSLFRELASIPTPTPTPKEPRPVPVKKEPRPGRQRLSPRITDEQWRWISGRLATGASCREVAKHFGVSASSISRRRKNDPQFLRESTPTPAAEATAIKLQTRKRSANRPPAPEPPPPPDPSEIRVRPDQPKPRGMSRVGKVLALGDDSGGFHIRSTNLGGTRFESAQPPEEWFDQRDAQHAQREENVRRGLSPTGMQSVRTLRGTFSFDPNDPSDVIRANKIIEADGGLVS